MERSESTRPECGQLYCKLFCSFFLYLMSKPNRQTSSSVCRLVPESRINLSVHRSQPFERVINPTFLFNILSCNISIDRKTGLGLAPHVSHNNSFLDDVIVICSGIRDGAKVRSSDRGCISFVETHGSLVTTAKGAHRDVVTDPDHSSTYSHFTPLNKSGTCRNNTAN